MANPVFPTLSVKPSISYDITPEDVGIVSQMSDGSQISRPRFTRSRLSFTYRWNAMTETDKTALLNFYCNTVKGSSLIWDWTDPDKKSATYGQIYHVRFATAPKFSRSTPNHWSVEISLQEA